MDGRQRPASQTRRHASRRHGRWTRTSGGAVRLSLAAKQARGETEPVPFETGKMAAYQQMRVNPVKSIGYNPIGAAAKIRAPMMILDAENEELMDRHQNG